MPLAVDKSIRDGVQPERHSVPIVICEAQTEVNVSKH